MDPRFILNNSHLEEAANFAELDPQSRRLSQQYYIHHSPLLAQLPITMPGIYTTQQLLAKDLKQVLKYLNSRIFTK